MEWLPLESSVFTSAAYDRDRPVVYLRFHSREVYRYFDFFSVPLFPLPQS
jgi:hypothetical protein